MYSLYECSICGKPVASSVDHDMFYSFVVATRVDGPRQHFVDQGPNVYVEHFQAVREVQVGVCRKCMHKYRLLGFLAGILCIGLTTAIFAWIYTTEIFDRAARIFLSVILVPVAIFFTWRTIVICYSMPKEKALWRLRQEHSPDEVFDRKQWEDMTPSDSVEEQLWRMRKNKEPWNRLP